MNWSSLLFEFNVYSGLLLPFVVQGIVMTILFFRRGLVRSQRADIILGILLFIYTLRVAYWMLGFAGWYDVKDYHTTFMFYFPFNHWLAVGPLIYFYFLEVTNHSFHMTRRHWWHFVPAGLFLLRYAIFFFIDIILNYWIAGEPLPMFYGTKGNLKASGLGILDQYWTYLEGISLFVYVMLTLRLYRRYKRYINDNFSDTSHINFNWLRNFLIANLIGMFIWFIFNIINLLSAEPLSFIQDWYSFFFLGIILYYISIAGYASGHDNMIISDLKFEPDLAPREQQLMSTQSADPTLIQLHQDLLRRMTKEKLYLDDEINLSTLARNLNCSTSALSKSINTIGGQNFNDFINRYRVDEFKQKAADPNMQQFSLLAIAHDCGFNSKATFNRAFKKQEGISPSTFVKSLE
jgi:AraC-like DNA-binding protein